MLIRSFRSLHHGGCLERQCIVCLANLDAPRDHYQCHAYFMLHDEVGNQALYNDNLPDSVLQALFYLNYVMSLSRMLLLLRSWFRSLGHYICLSVLRRDLAHHRCCASQGHSLILIQALHSSLERRKQQQYLS